MVLPIKHVARDALSSLIHWITQNSKNPEAELIGYWSQLLQ